MWERDNAYVAATVARFTAPVTVARSPGGAISRRPARVTKPAIEDGAHTPAGPGAIGPNTKK